MDIHNCNDIQAGILVVKRYSKKGPFWSVGVFQEDQSTHLFSYVEIKYWPLCGEQL